MYRVPQLYVAKEDIQQKIKKIKQETNTCVPQSIEFIYATNECAARADSRMMATNGTAFIVQLLVFTAALVNKNVILNETINKK